MLGSMLGWKTVMAFVVMACIVRARTGEASQARLDLRLEKDESLLLDVRLPSAVLFLTGFRGMPDGKRRGARSSRKVASERPWHDASLQIDSDPRCSLSACSEILQKTCSVRGNSRVADSLEKAISLYAHVHRQRSLHGQGRVVASPGLGRCTVVARSVHGRCTVGARSV